MQPYEIAAAIAPINTDAAFQLVDRALNSVPLLTTIRIVIGIVITGGAIVLFLWKRKKKQEASVAALVIGIFVGICILSLPILGKLIDIIVNAGISMINVFLGG
jgi:hypothetical protein